MIHYALQCDAGHAFDGWFAGSAAFDRQAEAGLIDCPRCGSASVSRALMAPAVGRSATGPAPAEAVPVPAPTPPARPLPSGMVAMLQKLRSAVEQTCSYVGPGFADEARRMHEGTIAARGIYGETTADEADALRDDGIEIARIPWVPRADG